MSGLNKSKGVACSITEVLWFVQIIDCDGSIKYAGDDLKLFENKLSKMFEYNLNACKCIGI